jgi:hypothetical protein
VGSPGLVRTLPGATLPAMEHPHRCVYCRSLWFCYEDCPLAGPSACEKCREKLLRSPETPRPVIPIERNSRVLDRLLEYDADRIRENLIRRRRPE